jgi:hypothetical protein
MGAGTGWHPQLAELERTDAVGETMIGGRGNSSASEAFITSGSPAAAATDCSTRATSIDPRIRLLRSRPDHVTLARTR